MSKIILTSNTTTSYSEIPLKDAKLILNVCDQIGEFTFIQNYINNSANPIEVFYTFPTPSYSSIFYFKAKIDNKTIKAILKEKKEAITEYNENIKQGNGAFLMERIDGDIFSICIGNFPPKTELTIKIKYIVELKTEIDATQLRIHIPLTIMPKYLMNNNLSEEALLHHKLVNPVKINNKPYNFEISGHIFMNDGINSLNSKNSKIKISNMNENSSLDFEIDDIDNLDEDVILSVNRNKPLSNVLTQKAINLNLNNEIYRYCTMVNIVPDFKNLPNINPSDSHYVLMLDRSGSMMGKDFFNCKEAAKLFINELPLDCSFDIYHFGSDFDKFKFGENNKIINSIECKLKAMEWIDQIQCIGGTEIYNVLLDAYSCIKQTEKNGIIILISDGGISNVETVLKLVRSNKNVNVFTIGIGDSVSQFLIEGMANEGNGKAEFINSGNDQLKDKVLSQLKRAQSCIRKHQEKNKIDIQVDGDYKMVPEIIPTLFENDLNTFFIFSQNEVKNITYTQILESYNLTTNIKLNQINHKDYLLHRMAGVKLIEHLQNKKEGSQLKHLNNDHNMSSYKQEIIMISLNLNILSKYTSFIGIEYKEKKITEPLILKEIPLQLPKKYLGTVGHYGSQGLPGPCGPQGLPGPCCPQGSLKSQGINTIGSSFRNASWDIRGAPSNPKYVCSPWNSDSNSDTDLYLSIITDPNDTACTPNNAIIDLKKGYKREKSVEDKSFEKDTKSLLKDLQMINEQDDIENIHKQLFDNGRFNINKFNAAFDSKEVDKYLPQEVNDDLFEVQPEPISVKNRHLINITKPIGINTIDTPKNSINKIKNEISENPQNKFKLKNKNIQPSKLKNDIKIKCTIFEQITNYTNSGNFMTSIKNEILPFGPLFFKIKVNDYICINNNKNDGIYKIISLGSSNSKWILEKIKEKSN